MSLFKRVNKKVRGWVLNHFNAVDADGYFRNLANAVESMKSMQEKCDELVRACRADIDTVKKIQHVTVSIPATWAPWYEDEKFSRLLWDKLKADYVMMHEDGDRKYASIAVIPKEALRDLSR